MSIEGFEEIKERVIVQSNCGEDEDDLPDEMLRRVKVMVPIFKLKRMGEHMDIDMITGMKGKELNINTAMAITRGRQALIMREKRKDNEYQYRLMNMTNFGERINEIIAENKRK